MNEPRVSSLPRLGPATVSGRPTRENPVMTVRSGDGGPRGDLKLVTPRTHPFDSPSTSHRNTTGLPWGTTVVTPVLLADILHPSEDPPSPTQGSLRGEVRSRPDFGPPTRRSGRLISPLSNTKKDRGEVPTGTLLIVCEGRDFWCCRGPRRARLVSYHVG